MTPPARTVAAALLRAGLVAAVLAIISGLFGMHVMTGNHASHGDHTAAVPVKGGHSDTGHPDTGHSDVGHVAAGHAGAAHAEAAHAEMTHAEAVHTGASDITSCAGSCHRVQDSGASCIPSAKAGELTVFPPGESGVVVRAGPGSPTGPAAAYPHTPPSPTPCELSISRT